METLDLEVSPGEAVGVSVSHTYESVYESTDLYTLVLLSNLKSVRLLGFFVHSLMNLFLFYRDPVGCWGLKGPSGLPGSPVSIH